MNINPQQLMTTSMQYNIQGETLITVTNCEDNSFSNGETARYRLLPDTVERILWEINYAKLFYIILALIMFQ